MATLHSEGKLCPGQSRTDADPGPKPIVPKILAVVNKRPAAHLG